MALNPTAEAGSVYLVGAGPGTLDLLTLRAHALISSATCLLHDDLVSDQVLALAGPATLVRNVGKRCGIKTITQQEINTWMIGIRARRPQCRPPQERRSVALWPRCRRTRNPERSSYPLRNRARRLHRLCRRGAGRLTPDRAHHQFSRAVCHAPPCRRRHQRPGRGSAYRHAGALYARQRLRRH